MFQFLYRIFWTSYLSQYYQVNFLGIQKLKVKERSLSKTEKHNNNIEFNLKHETTNFYPGNDH